MKNKKIAVFGTGYVGLVTGVCLSDFGNRVVCVDIDELKLANLSRGIVPFFEPGLDELIKKNKNNLEFTTNARYATDEADVIFIAVGTPQREDGSCDLSFINEVAETISQHIKSKKIIVVKSTVEVGTCAAITGKISKNYKGGFAVLSNPEFLKEGSAIEDFMSPDRIVIGGKDGWAIKELEELYKPLNCPTLVTDWQSSELIKYASNSFLATKISFINSIANLSEKVGADINHVSAGVGLDSRIGPKFLNAGLGYGGSCFPKDVSALLNLGKKSGQNMGILEAVDDLNKKQKTIPVKKLQEKIDLKNSKVAVLGLSFKPETDDIREAPSLEIINQLLEKGARVWAWDPISEEACRKIIPNVHYCPNPYEALDNADAAIIVTEWGELRELDLRKVKEIMKRPLIIDGRNILSKSKTAENQIEYYGIGR